MTRVCKLCIENDLILKEEEEVVVRRGVA